MTLTTLFDIAAITLLILHMVGLVVLSTPVIWCLSIFLLLPVIIAALLGLAAMFGLCLIGTAAVATR